MRAVTPFMRRDREQHARCFSGVKTADCVPILIGDTVTGAFAAIHAGWRGTLAEIATKTLKRMSANYNSKPGDVVVAIGPSAGSCCYEVGTDVIDAFRNACPGEELFCDRAPITPASIYSKLIANSWLPLESIQTKSISRRYARCAARTCSSLIGAKKMCKEKSGD